MDSFDKKKREKLKKILRDLAKSDAIKSKEDICDYLNQLKQIYFSDNKQVFTHCYSDIFPLLTKLKEAENSIDSVGGNLGSILNYSKRDKNPEVYRVLKKLWDHTNLEIERINYVDSIDTRLDITGKTLEEKYKTLQKKYKNITAEAEKINQKQQEITDTVDRVSNIYSEFISILGIFSAVVLVYFGGTSIIGNVLGAIDETFIFKGILICLVAGMIVFNIIFMFLYFLAKILDRSISATPYGVEYENILSRFKLRYPIIYYVNFFAISAIIIDVLIWLFVLLFNNTDFINSLNLFVNDRIINKYYIKCLLVIGIIIFNLWFVGYYIFCKSTSRVLGNFVRLKHTNKHKFIKERNSYSLQDVWEGTYKSYNSYITARIVWLYKNYILLIINTIKNFFIRLFLRHRVFIWVNIIIIVFFCLL